MLTTNVLVPVEIKADKKFVDAYYKASVDTANNQLIIKLELGMQGKIKPEKELPGYKSNSINRMLYQDLLVVSLGKEMNIERSHLLDEPPGKGGLIRYFNNDGTTTDRVVINHLEIINEIILPAMESLLTDSRHSHHAKFNSMCLVAVKLFTAIVDDNTEGKKLENVLLTVLENLKEKQCYISPQIEKAVKDIKALPKAN